MTRWKHDVYIAALLIGYTGVTTQLRAQSPYSLPSVFHVGEVREFAIKVGGLPAGTAKLSIDSLGPVHGTVALKATLQLRGSALYGSFSRHYETWIEAASLSHVLGLLKSNPRGTYQVTRPDRSPVLLEYLRMDTARAKAGIVQCVVFRPHIRNSAILRDDSDLEVWLSLSRAEVVRIKTMLSVFPVSLSLTSVSSVAQTASGSLPTGVH